MIRWFERQVLREPFTFLVMLPVVAGTMVLHLPKGWALLLIGWVWAVVHVLDQRFGATTPQGDRSAERQDAEERLGPKGESAGPASAGCAGNDRPPPNPTEKEA